MTSQSLADVAGTPEHLEDQQTFAFESRPCQDPECDGTAEQEKDYDHLYWECTECGFSFGYAKVGESSQAEPTCAMGMTEDQRQVMDRVDASPSPVPVTIGRKPS